MTTLSSIPNTLFFYHPSSSNAIKNFVLTKSVYDTLTVFNHLTGCKALEFQFPLRDNPGSLRHTLDSQGLLNPSGHYKQLTNLNPWMYWSGRGNLKLDYVEYYDDIFANYTNNPDRRSKLRSYENMTNLRHFQGMDEPKAPNFASCKKLKEYLQTTFPADERYLVGAINLDHCKLKKNDGTPYRLPDAYRKFVSPRKIMINVYPFTGDLIRWNNKDHIDFVQNYLDKLCAEYNHFRLKVGTGNKLVFITDGTETN